MQQSLSPKLSLASIVPLCLWISFGASEEQKIILPDEMGFSLYEGLYHSDVDRFNSNKLNDSIIRINGYRFFKKPIKLAPADKHRIISLLEKYTHESDTSMQ